VLGLKRKQEAKGKQMKYLKSFNHRLAEQRRRHKLTPEDVAVICGVDVQVVLSWESPYESQRTYPSADNLIDLCVRAGLRLEKLIDLDFSPVHLKQFELPGLGLSEEPDLGRSLDELQDAIETLLPTEEERELLKGFRHANAEKKRRVLELLGAC